MDASDRNSQFFIAMLVLLAIHSAVSFAAYRWFTKTTLLRETSESSPVEVTTPEEQARGEIVFQTGTTIQEYSVTIPTVVVWYMWGGYGGLAGSLLWWGITWIRHKPG